MPWKAVGGTKANQGGVHGRMELSKSTPEHMGLWKHTVGVQEASADEALPMRF